MVGSLETALRVAKTNSVLLIASACTGVESSPTSMLNNFNFASAVTITTVEGVLLVALVVQMLYTYVEVAAIALHAPYDYGNST
jgi:hypothetical protein